MKVLHASLLAASAFLASFGAAAAIQTTNNTQGGLWVTIYDVGKTMQLDYGCVGPNQFRTWTNALYAKSPYASQFIVRAELTPDAACKQPRVCDTTATVKDNDHAFLNTRLDADGRAILAKCSWRVGMGPGDAQGDASLKFQQCRATARPAIAAARDLYARVVAGGKAPREVLEKAVADLNSLNRVAGGEYDFWESSTLLQLCSSSSQVLARVTQALTPHLPASAPLNTLAPRMQAALDVVVAAQKRLDACTARVPAFTRGTFAIATRTAGSILHAQLAGDLPRLKADTRTDGAAYADTAKAIDKASADARAFGSNVDRECATAK